MKEQSDMPRTEMAEGQGLNPYFEGRFDGESDELCALRLTLARERDEARISVAMLWAAAKLAESALADIGDSDHEPTDDLAWCELRAQRTLPVVRFALAATEPKP